MPESLQSFQLLYQHEFAKILWLQTLITIFINYPKCSSVQCLTTLHFSGHTGRPMLMIEFA